MCPHKLLYIIYINMARLDLDKLKITPGHCNFALRQLFIFDLNKFKALIKICHRRNILWYWEKQTCFFLHCYGNYLNMFLKCWTALENFVATPKYQLSGFNPIKRKLKCVNMGFKNSDIKQNIHDRFPY